MKPSLSALLLAVATCGAQAAPIDGATLLEQIGTLASDEFEGRAPGTHGELLTLDYLQQQFKKLGLEPGNPDGTYLQAVPLVGISSHPTLSYTKDGQRTALKFGDDYIAWGTRAEPHREVSDSELVFVGYGIQAPEFRWDDYKGADLKGKTLVMLINDPPLPDPKHPRRLDPAQFGGNAVTWYGRWNYKLEMAARMGAAAVLIVHDTRTAGYPYETVVNNWGRENYALRSRQAELRQPPLAGWLQQDRACALFQAAGMDCAALRQQALSRGFRPLPLGITLNLSVLNATRTIASHNVVARIPGSDPQLRHETVVYSAHWDHFGIDDTLPGPRTRQIFHGAVDNASGVAGLLQIARAYKALPQAPRRTILFIATTGQERGLLGAQYYVQQPLYPIDKTILNINIDGLNLWGRTREVELSGMGKSSADQLVQAAAARQGRLVRPDSHAGAGSYYRGDQLEFARAGVPTIYLRSSAQRQLFYTAHHYHTVNDVVQPNWNTAGAVEDLTLLFQAGYQAAQGKTTPQWQAGAEFHR